MPLNSIRPSTVAPKTTTVDETKKDLVGQLKEKLATGAEPDAGGSRELKNQGWGAKKHVGVPMVSGGSGFDSGRAAQARKEISPEAKAKMQLRKVGEDTQDGSKMVGQEAAEAKLESKVVDLLGGHIHSVEDSE